jgi:hypothetical protein
MKWPLFAHSITSSALPSSGSGTVRPRALAVLRLMINWNFVSMAMSEAESGLTLPSLDRRFRCSRSQPAAALTG